MLSFLQSRWEKMLQTELLPESLPIGPSKLASTQKHTEPARQSTGPLMVTGSVTGATEAIASTEAAAGDAGASISPAAVSTIAVSAPVKRCLPAPRAGRA